MTPLNLFGKKEKTLAELDEETELRQAEAKLVDAEFSVAQKREMIRQLKVRGLKPSYFGSWSKVWQWLKTH